MRHDELSQPIQSELLTLVQQLKTKSGSELSALVRSPIKHTRSIGTHTLEFTAWAEETIEGHALAVFVDTWTKGRWFSSRRHMLGFILDEHGSIRDLSESELWDYD
jgi:hypothetical protein